MNETLGTEDLVQRAKTGQVTSDEIERIARVLSTAADADVYRLLYVLIRVGAREHEDLIARFLHYPRDPQVAALALSSLCVQWGLSLRYREKILEAMAGEEWDVLDEVKQAGIAAAGEHLRAAADPVMLERLIDVAETYETELDGRFALEAIARALGEPHAAATFPRDTNDGRSWAQQILARAEIRLVAERPAN